MNNLLLDLLGLTPAELLARFDAGVERAAATALQQRLDTLPDVDYQLTIPQAAQVLNLDAGTVRGYTELLDGEPRKLYVVKTSDTARGHRVMLSQLNDWQQRNRTDPDDAETLRRKAAKARRKKPAAAPGGAPE